jgi:NADH dehydrogenase
MKRKHDMASTRPPRLLILGSGYVAITCTRKMRRAMRNGEIDVTVVSRENFHCFHGSVGEMLTGLVSTGTIATPGRRLFLPAKILIANVTGVDLHSQQVTIRRLEDGTPSTLSYDHLVIAVGSSDNFAMYPGLKEHAHCLKTYEECFRLKSHIIQQFDKACLATAPAERRALLTFVIAGGGYAGTEITGQLSDLIRELTRTTYKEIAASECRIILATRSKTILPELFFGKKASGYGVGHPSLVNYATDHLRGLGAEIMVETRVVRATPSHAHLSNGEIIPTRTIINAVGITPVPLVEQLAVEKDECGRIVCTADMRVKGFDNVWSAGDCAALPHLYGGYCPPVGTFAIEEGKHLGKNVLRAIRGRQTRPFEYVGIGQGVSIGHRNAILEVKGIKMRDLGAWII